MGIPFYFQVILQSYPQILRYQQPVKCGSLFLDFNGAIHQAARAVLDAPVQPPDQDELERHIMGAVWDYHLDIVQKASPTGEIHICIDGVAPVAKMSQQRKRRYMSVLRHKLAAKAAAAPTWDTNAISPGTPFMARLQAFLKSRIRDHAQGPRMRLSAADECGEGEHKMFARMAALPSHDPVFVYGLDADLFMLSLLSHRPRIYLMREPTGPQAKAAAAASSEDGFLYVEIDALRHGILRELSHKHGWPVPEEALSDSFHPSARPIIESYIVLCFLLGNDFLPHVPTLHLRKGGLVRILQEAGQMWPEFGHGPVVFAEGDPTDGVGKIAWPFLTEVLRRLAEDEDEVLWRITEEYLKKRPYPTSDPTDSYPLVQKDPVAHEIYNLALPNTWRTVYYQRLFYTRRNDTSVIASSCAHFLQGIEWTYRYYRRIPKDPWWYYPHEFSPSLRDLANYAAMFQPEAAPVPTPGSADGGQFVEPLIQLLCIMPPESAHLLPTKVRPLMSDPCLGCAHLFPKSYEVRTFLKTHLWECAPILPPLDIPLLKECVQRLQSLT